MQYAYQDRGGRWVGDFDTIKGAISEAINEELFLPGEVVKVGEVWPRHADEFFGSPGTELLEYMRQNTEDEVGEYADDWLMGVSVEEEEELNTALRVVLSDWFKRHRHHRPTFFSVEGVHEYTIPEGVNLVD